jgi:hypothetical protein
MLVFPYSPHTTEHGGDTKRSDFRPSSVPKEDIIEKMKLIKHKQGLPGTAKEKKKSIMIAVCLLNSTIFLTVNPTLISLTSRRAVAVLRCPQNI